MDSQTLSEIESVEKIEEGESFLYKIQTNDPEKVKRQLLKLSLEKNINILSLQSETRSLEQIFKNLTSNN